MKEIIVPDVHEQIDKLNRIEPFLLKADRVVFLGDWFDSFKPGRALETAQWLKAHLRQPGWEFLLGNHDCHYFFDNRGFMCSGYNPHTKAMVRENFDREDILQFGISTYTNDKRFLLSHAGFRPETKHFLGEGLVALDAALRGNFHPLWEPGRARGGRAEFGGPTWLDFTWEFQNLRQQLQIVGHTSGSNVRHCDSPHGKSYCIDNGLRTLAVYEDGNLEFVKVEEL